MPDWLQRTIAAAILAALSPFLVLIALVVRLDSPGPVLFRAARIGHRGRPFVAWKFRTMIWRPHQQGPAISRDADSRVTRVGSWLRAIRADELPQLWNVVRGQMRLVGPRPEDPRFVDLDSAAQLATLAVRPGITCLAQLAFADEARVLAEEDPEGAYRLVILPRKLLVDQAYARQRSVRLDLRIMAATVRVALGGPPPAAEIDRLVGRSDWRLPEPPNHGVV